MTPFCIRALAGCVLVAGLQFTGAARADVFVTNYAGSGSVSEYSSAGAFVRTFVSPGSGGLAGANNLHFAADGNLYVASDSGIKIYDGSTGAYLRDFVSAGTLDFTFDAAGNVYAVDNVKLLKYGPDGTLLATYTDGISTPQGVTLAADGHHLLVSNTYAGAWANTVTSLDPADGSFTTFATGLGEPVGIALGSDGRAYVANFAFALSFGGTHPNTIQVIAAGGGVSSTWNQGGSLNGPTYLTLAEDKLFVTSYYNGTVYVFDAATGESLGGFDAGTHVEGIAYRPEPVPEPSGMGLLGAGLAGLLGLRRVRAAMRADIAAG
jgi:hypothetical protein